MSTVLDEKIASLSRYITRIQARLPQSAEALRADVDAQDILSVNLQRAVQLCVDMAVHVLAQNNEPSAFTMAESFLRLSSKGIISETTARQMVAAVGFRNISVQAYREVDWAIVYAIATQHLDDFRRFAKEVVTPTPG